MSLPTVQNMPYTCNICAVYVPAYEAHWCPQMEPLPTPTPSAFSLVHRTEYDLPAGPATLLREDPGGEDIGEWKEDQRVIRVAPDISVASAWQTLGHEIGHGWMSDAGVKHFLSPRQLEAVCDAIGTGLARLIG